MLTLLILNAAFAVTPPAELKPWIDYARGIYPDTPACAPGRSCIQLERFDIAGQAALGQLTITVSGGNLGALVAEAPLFGTASRFAVVDARFIKGRGALLIRGEDWVASVFPGDFVAELQVRYEPDAETPLAIKSPVAQISDHLSQGHLSFDPDSNRHIGFVFIASQEKKVAAEKPVILASRLFRYGSILTFRYHFALGNIRTETRIDLPLLGGEAFESVDPAVSYKLNGNSLSVTVGPGTPRLTLIGHFNEGPAQMQKPAALEFEHWLIESDPRHPVLLTTNGAEIDPAEVKDLKGDSSARAFFLKGGQKIDAQPITVSIDPNRQGSANVELSYVHGYEDFWMGSLSMSIAAKENTDRLAIVTPALPHFAAVGGDAIRMFREGDSLSVQNPAALQHPISVQWREIVPTNAVLSLLHLPWPAQKLHLDSLSAKIALQPGYVAFAVFGVESARGHVMAGVQLYALLLAALAVAMARAARFPRWATVITAVLFAGLYGVEGFPRTEVLLLLTGCAMLKRLPFAFLEQVCKDSRWRFLIIGGWLVLLVLALAPSLLYVQERLFSALHPWSQADKGGVFLGVNEPNLVMPAAAPPAAQREDEVEYDGAAEEEAKSGSERQRLKKSILGGSVAQSLSSDTLQASRRQAEVTVKPILLQSSLAIAEHVEYSFGSLLPNEGAAARVVLVGPLLRGVWMFAESVGLIALLTLATMATRRLWSVVSVSRKA